MAFHAAFDRRSWQRALRQAGLPALRNRWIDLAELAPALHPDTKARALDDWLDAFGIGVTARHQAGSDAFATAMLFAACWPTCRRRSATCAACGRAPHKRVGCGADPGLPARSRFPSHGVQACCKRIVRFAGELGSQARDGESPQRARRHAVIEARATSGCGRPTRLDAMALLLAILHEMVKLAGCSTSPRG